MNLMKPGYFVSGLLLILSLVVVLLIELFPLQAQSTIRFEKIVLNKQLSEPTGVAFRLAQPDQLWIVNHGNDAVTIVTHPGQPNMQVETRTDAYAEHFVAKPTGVTFGYGDTFAVSNDSINEVRGMKFVQNPERNKYFVKSHFMGPSLFSAGTYALAGQNKRYLDDWPQPGFGHDAPDNLTPAQGCPQEFWSLSDQRCYWPREGSHLDMLHESPLAMGIVHDQGNAYFVLDGCGNRDQNNQCLGNGHLVRYDFNRDHQEGNGFHGDGIVRRYPEIAFKRLENVPSGMVMREGWLYFANSGSGAIARAYPSKGNIQTLVSSWSGQAEQGRVGPGLIDWINIPNSPGDGDSPDTIKTWIQTKGNLDRIRALGKSWIPPAETLSEYSYVYNVPQEPFISVKWLNQPSGLAGDQQALYVADYKSGWIAAFDWKTSKVLWRYQSHLTSISGLTINPSRAKELYLTDRATNALYRLSW